MASNDEIRFLASNGEIRCMTLKMRLDRFKASNDGIWYITSNVKLNRCITSKCREYSLANGVTPQ